MLRSRSSLNWQFAAAVYNSFTTTYSSLGVKPVDSNTASQYKNSDHAGTPENDKTHVVGGAMGGGGSNYTGSYSATASVTPVVGTPDTPTANAGPAQTVNIGATVQLTAPARPIRGVATHLFLVVRIRACGQHGEVEQHHFRYAHLRRRQDRHLHRSVDREQRFQ
jgi:hypothetical protein